MFTRIYAYGILALALFMGYTLVFNFVHPWAAIIGAIVLIGVVIHLVEKKVKSQINKSDKKD